MLEPMPKQENENPNEWFVEYCRKVQIDTIEIHKILNSSSYIDWLINFSVANPYLSAENISPTNNYSEEDLTFISKLKYLYESIRMYADKSYIAPYDIDGSYVYYLQYGDIIFKIGQSLDKNKTCFYERMSTLPDYIIVIDFKDMQEDKNMLQNDSIKVSLTELAHHIELLLNNGVPKEDIIKTTEETIKLNLTQKD